MGELIGTYFGPWGFFIFGFWAQILDLRPILGPWDHGPMGPMGPWAHSGIRRAHCRAVWWQSQSGRAGGWSGSAAVAMFQQAGQAYNRSPLQGDRERDFVGNCWFHFGPRAQYGSILGARNNLK